MAISMSEPAVLGVLAGGLVFVLLLVPILVWQTRAYGRVTFGRLVGAGAVSVYVAALAAYTLLPSSPMGTDVVAWCAEHGFDGVNLNPLQFAHDIGKEAAGKTGLAAVMNIAVLQLGLNVALFIPWGVLARGYLGWSRRVSIASAFVASLAIEATQATGAFGLIPCSYRYGDVDDLLTNVLGAVLGVLIAPLVLGWMPQGRDLARTRGVPRPVTVRRRWFGMLMDWLVYGTVLTVIASTWGVVRVALGMEYPAAGGFWHWVAVGVLPAVLVFLLPALVGSGASIGQRIAWLVPQWPDPPTLGRRLLRAAIPSGAWAVLSILPFSGSPVPSTDRYLIASFLIAVVAVVSVVATRDHRGISGALSGCRYVDGRAGAYLDGRTADRTPTAPVVAPATQNASPMDVAPVTGATVPTGPATVPVEQQDVAVFPEKDFPEGDWMKADDRELPEACVPRT